jgi:hypothetical protein
MRLAQFLVAIALLCCTVTVSAADLTKVDRTIQKEPAYHSKPKYCLLVFGPEARQRVWLVLDGDTLYVDKNGNGDLTEEGKRIEAAAFGPSDHPAQAQEREIRAGGVTVGGLTHTGLVVTQTEHRRKVDTSHGTGANTPEEWQEYLDGIWRQVPDGTTFMVSINLDPACYGLFDAAKGRRILHFAWTDQKGQLCFGDRPQTAPIIHFGGPLTLRASPSEKLHPGGPPDRVTLNLGTVGLGPGSFATMSHDLVPKGVHPVVEARFPPQAPGREGVTVRYVLEERC